MYEDSLGVGVATTSWTAKITEMGVKITHNDGGTQLLRLLGDVFKFYYVLAIVLSTQVSTGKVYSNDRQELKQMSQLYM